MKVLLTKDVYKLGRAGDVKRVADGFGRNFLLPDFAPTVVRRTAGVTMSVDTRPRVTRTSAGSM